MSIYPPRKNRLKEIREQGVQTDHVEVGISFPLDIGDTASRIEFLVETLYMWLCASLPAIIMDAAIWFYWYRMPSDALTDVHWWITAFLIAATHFLSIGILLVIVRLACQWRVMSIEAYKKWSFRFRDWLKFQQTTIFWWTMVAMAFCLFAASHS